MNKFFILLCLLFVGNGIYAQTPTDSLSSWLEKGYIKGYGVVNYYNFDWETDPDRRNAFDAE